MSRHRVFICLFVRYCSPERGQAFDSLRHGGYTDLNWWNETYDELSEHFPLSRLADRHAPELTLEPLDGHPRPTQNRSTQRTARTHLARRDPRTIVREIVLESPPHLGRR